MLPPLNLSVEMSTSSNATSSSGGNAFNTGARASVPDYPPKTDWTKWLALGAAGLALLAALKYFRGSK